METSAEGDTIAEPINTEEEKHKDDDDKPSETRNAQRTAPVEATTKDVVMDDVENKRQPNWLSTRTRDLDGSSSSRTSGAAGKRRQETTSCSKDRRCS